MGFQQGLSGLSAMSRNLDVIGNNVANASTVGFKSSRAEFADVYAKSLNGGASSSVGIGATVAAVSQQFTQGELQTTNSSLDVAISGRGFFRLSDNGAITYSRNGQFQADSEGYLVNSQGLRLQGFGATSAGTPTSTWSDLRLDLSNNAPSATTSVELSANLDATTPDATNPFDVNDPTSYTGSTALTVFDSQGQEHALSMYFRKSADNTWEVYGTGDGAPIGAGAIGTLVFDTSGVLDTAASPQPVSITFPVGAAAGGSTPIDVDFTALTQFGVGFGVNDVTQDGYAPGQLIGFSIADDGNIEGRYSNGQSRVQGFLALADFRNPQGLAPVGGNQWVATPESGTEIPGLPRSANFGSLQSGALEGSNVDLTAELVNMIVAQRMYQANAQTVRTQDQVLQTLVNLR